MTNFKNDERHTYNDDAAARKWTVEKFLPSKVQGLTSVTTDDRCNPSDLLVTAITNGKEVQGIISVKTRYADKNGNPYTYQYMVEHGGAWVQQSNIEHIKNNLGHISLLMYLQDCIVWFPASKLEEAYMGSKVMKNCPNQKNVTGKYGGTWEEKDKNGGMFNVEKGIRYEYESFGGIPEFVSSRQLK